jgi:hypothetical protein
MAGIPDWAGWRGRTRSIRDAVFDYPGSILLCLLSAYLVARIAVLRSGTLKTWPDAASYAYSDTRPRDPGSLVSFTGHAPRLWGAPLLFALFHSDAHRVQAQWAISTVAWALLAGALWTCLRSTPAKVVASAAVLSFALLTLVTEWDFTILSESLSISLGVTVVAGFLLWLRTGARSALVGMTAAAFYWTFVRAELRLFVVVLGAVLVFLAWRRRDLRRWALGAVLVLVVAVGWCTAIMPAVLDALGRYTVTHMSANSDVLMFRLGNTWGDNITIYGDPQFQHIYEDELGMPKCPAAADYARARPDDFFGLVDRFNSCPDLHAWADRNGDAPLQFALAAPDQAARQVWNVAPRAFGGIDRYGLYGGAKPFFPNRVDRAMFQPSRTGLAVLFGGLLLAIVAAWATGAFRRRRLLTVSALVITVTALVSEVVGVLYLDIEASRYAVQEDFAVRIALLMLVVAALDAFVERRTRRQDGYPQEQEPAAPPQAPVTIATPREPADASKLPAVVGADSTSRGAQDAT